MKQLSDFLPILLFFIVYKFYLDLPDELILGINDWLPLMQLTPGESSDAIYLATLTAIIATLIQVSLALIIAKKVEKMPLITLGLLLVFGGATLAFKDPLFIQWKPTAINWLFALVFLASHLIGDKPLVQRMVMNLFLMSSGMVVAPAIDPFGLQFSEDNWVDFKLFGLMGMTIAFVVAQAFFLAKYLSPGDKETN